MSSVGGTGIVLRGVKTMLPPRPPLPLCIYRSPTLALHRRIPDAGYKKLRGVFKKWNISALCQATSCPRRPAPGRRLGLVTNTNFKNENEAVTP